MLYNKEIRTSLKRKRMGLCEHVNNIWDCMNRFTKLPISFSQRIVRKVCRIWTITKYPVPCDAVYGPVDENALSTSRADPDAGSVADYASTVSSPSPRSPGWTFRETHESSNAFHEFAMPSLIHTSQDDVGIISAPRSTHNNALHVHSPSSSQKFKSFLSRPFRSNPLKRTKSVSKLDRIKRSAFDKDSLSSYWSPVIGPRPIESMSHRNGIFPGVGAPRLLGSLDNNWSAATAAPFHLRRTAAPPPPPLQRRCRIAAVRNSRSHESLLAYSATTHAVDLVADDAAASPLATATPLHPSLLGAPHCFQVRTAYGATKYYACRTTAERDRWIYSLRTMQPGYDLVKRQENSLQMWVFAAKGLQAKKRYYCEIYLDKILYCRTTSKVKLGDECFWGERFEISQLPNVETLRVNLCKESERRRRRDSKSNLIGHMTITVSSLMTRHPIEKWYNVINGDKKCDCSSLRIKAHYQSITVMPLRVYDSFVEFIKKNYLELCSAVESVTTVKCKENIATCLVHIFHRLHLAKEFLTDLVIREVRSLDNYHLMFRANSLATKAMEAYMKLVGEQYLHDTLSDFVQSVLESNEDCEVDPSKVPNLVTLERQQENLTRHVHSAWGKIVNSVYDFPMELRTVFGALRRRLSGCDRDDLADYLISSNIFLRFLCPAVLSPSLFNLIQEYPDEHSARNLTLIAKTIQTLANFTKFGVKEQYMEFMNKFVEGESEHMRQYLGRISSSPPQDFLNKCFGWEINVDLGKELSLLHSYLLESWSTIQANIDPLKSQELRQCLDHLTERLKETSGFNYRLNPETPASPMSDYENNCTNKSGGAHFNNGAFKQESRLSVPNSNPDQFPKSPSSSSNDSLPQFSLSLSRIAPKSRKNSTHGGSDAPGTPQILKRHQTGFSTKIDNSKFYLPEFSPNSAGCSAAGRISAGNSSVSNNLDTNDDYVWRSAIDANLASRTDKGPSKRNFLLPSMGRKSSPDISKSADSLHISVTPDDVTAASAVTGLSTAGFSYADESSNVTVAAKGDDATKGRRRRDVGGTDSGDDAAQSSSGYQSLTYSGTSDGSGSPTDTVNGVKCKHSMRRDDDSYSVALNSLSLTRKTYDYGHHEPYVCKVPEQHCCKPKALAISNPLYALHTVPLCKQKSASLAHIHALCNVENGRNRGSSQKISSSVIDCDDDVTLTSSENLGAGKITKSASIGQQGQLETPSFGRRRYWPKRKFCLAEKENSRVCDWHQSPASVPRTNPHCRILTSTSSLPPLPSEKVLRRTKTDLDMAHPNGFDLSERLMSANDRNVGSRSSVVNHNDKNSTAFLEAGCSEPIINRLKLVESELHDEMNNSCRKEQIIEAQRKRIEMLQSLNDSLLATLNDLKQQHSQLKKSRQKSPNGDEISAVLNLDEMADSCDLGKLKTTQC